MHHHMRIDTRKPIRACQRQPIAVASLQIQPHIRQTHHRINPLPSHRIQPRWAARLARFIIHQMYRSPRTQHRHRKMNTFHVFKSWQTLKMNISIVFKSWKNDALVWSRKWPRWHCKSKSIVFKYWLRTDFQCLFLFRRENARLKSIHHNLVMSRHSSRHFLVSIPRVLLQRREGSNKKYFAYEIRIAPISGENESWSLLRRYSEFHRLDKYLQKSNPMIKTLDFPPKKSFGNMVSA